MDLEPPSDLRSRLLPGGDQPDGVVFTTVLVYSCAILGSPLITFFAAQWLLTHGLGWDAASVAVNVGSAVAAVVVLHVALAAFIYKAYFEDSKTKIGKKD